MRISANKHGNYFTIFNQTRTALEETHNRVYERYPFHITQRDNRKKQITLRVSKEQYIRITVHYKDELCLWGRVIITLYDNTTLTKYDLCTDNNWIERAIYDFVVKIILAIQGDLALHPSITEDLGYLWNQLLHEQNQDPAYWIGHNNLLWSTSQGRATWLYNKNGKIFLETTSTYDWHFFDPQENCAIESYEDYMRSYKPDLIMEVSPELLLEWLEPLQKILSAIEKRCTACQKFMHENPLADDTEGWVGFVMWWDQLTDFQKLSAIANGLADNRGKILR